jgi:hypothetical protein
MSPKPRHPRLPKEARVLKLIVAEARPDTSGLPRRRRYRHRLSSSARP